MVAVGSPLVDVLARSTEEDLERTGLVKGSMGLTDLERSDEIYAALGPTVEASGGSAANTAVGVAALGGRAGFVGKIADDALGKVFTHDIRAAGVEYQAIVAEGTGEGTGRCLVQVTPDGERTMATHLGAASTIVPGDLPLDMIDRAGILYLEAYLWDVPAAIDAMRTAIGRAHDHGAVVALSLSDSFCVGRHQRDFLDLLVNDIDVLFANEEEIVSLFGSPSFEAAASSAAETGLLVAITRGAQGSVVVTAGGPVAVPAEPVAEVVDTTGAGDLYAAGFCYGLAVGADPERCAQLGSLCAAEVISHLGARNEHDLRQLAGEAGLL